jgi:hypothetical protein
MYIRSCDHNQVVGGFVFDPYDRYSYVSMMAAVISIKSRLTKRS